MGLSAAVVQDYEALCESPDVDLVYPHPSHLIKERSGAETQAFFLADMWGYHLRFIARWCLKHCSVASMCFAKSLWL